MIRVRRKFARAETHAQELDASVRGGIYTTEGAYRGESPLYKLVPEFNDDVTECRLRLKQIGEPPIDDWAVILGDVLHNLRSCLDHLAHQLALAHEPDKDPPTGTEFPIFVDRDKFRSQDRGGGLYKVRGLHPDVIGAIATLQPHNTPEHPLWVLQQMSNADKHRLGIVHAVEIGHPLVEGPYWHDVRPTSERWERGPYEDGEVVATYGIRAAGENPRADVYFKPTIVVSADEGIGRAPRPLFLLIPNLMSAVEQVIDLFAPRLPG